MKDQIHFNPENERIKRKYFEYLKEAGQKSQATIDNVAKSILRHETVTKFADFGRFRKVDAIALKNDLAGSKNQKGEFLSKSTIFATTRDVKTFFKWLAYQAGYKSRISLLDLEYFNISEKDIKMAKAKVFKEFPTLEQIHKVISLMPSETEIQKRDRALIAFTILSGMRDRAIVSLKLKHIDLNRELINQDSREVKTKASKMIITYFFPVGEDIKRIVIDWINYLQENKLFPLTAPLFPRTKTKLDENNNFTAAGVEPVHWSGANQVREIFKIAFNKAGLPYYNPHSFRNTIVNLGERRCQNPEQFKVWSQNLGHENVLTTFTSYGSVDVHRQGELIKNMILNPENKPVTKNDIRDLMKEMALQNKQEMI
jgi:integrase/recombinase XerD